MNVVWSPEALESLVEIHSYLHARSARRAHRVLDEITRGADKLSSMPFLGREVPSLRLPQIRQLIVESYRVVYQVGPNGVEILIVLHGARDFQIG